MAANTLFWGVPAAIYCYLAYARISVGNALVWWLLALGPGAYCAGLFLAVVIPAILLWFGKTARAMTLAAALLPLGLMFGAWGVLMLGSG